MNRRSVLAGLLGVGLTGGAAWVAVNGVQGDQTSVVVDTIDAQGSTAGRQRIPVPGTVTVVDLFATWCAPCKAQMQTLNAVYTTFREDVAFVSVTNEQVGNGLSLDDIRAWWRAHDGNWTVGHDPESRLFRALNAGGLPYLALADTDGTVVWTHRGLASEAALTREIRRALGNGADRE